MVLYPKRLAGFDRLHVRIKENVLHAGPKLQHRFAHHGLNGLAQDGLGRPVTSLIKKVNNLALLIPNGLQLDR